MAVTKCPQCQAELSEGSTVCPVCGSSITVAQPVNVAPAFAGAAIFVVVLLLCEWIQVIWPVALTGVAYLSFLVFKYGKLAYVAPVPSPAKIEAEIPVGMLLEKVEVPEPEEEKRETPNEAVCASCGTPKGGAVRFCGNCGKPF
jgi:hypothetical protein